MVDSVLTRGSGIKRALQRRLSTGMCGGDGGDGTGNTRLGSKGDTQPNITGVAVLALPRAVGYDGDGGGLIRWDGTSSDYG